MKNLTINEIIERGILSIGTKARGNPDSINFDRFAIGIANKDYAAQTPFLWNSAYKSLGLKTRNIRMFAEPEHSPTIFAAFRDDPRYIGGDVGVGATGEGGDLVRREARPGLWDVQAAVRRQARQHRIPEADRRGPAPGGNVPHVSPAACERAWRHRRRSRTTRPR